MSENRNRGTRDFSKYDSMSTEELKNILRLDSEAPVEQESDTDLMLHIMEVLASRTTHKNTGKTAFESWKAFQQDYLCEEDVDVHKTIISPKPRKLHYRWLRRLTTVAAMLALVISIAATANAIKWDTLWNTLAKWAHETFSFVTEEQQRITEPSPHNTLQYSSLQEALKCTEQEYDFVPTWIPEGYQLEEIVVDENPIQTVYAARYKNKEQVLKITVRLYLKNDLENIEISSEPLEIYNKDGTEYHIFTNYDELRAVWIKAPYECYIAGDLSVEEIKLMIDSIRKG